jgi:hypothetical protein
MSEKLLNPACNHPCMFEKEGNCFFAEQIKSQADFKPIDEEGKWTREKWNEFLKRFNPVLDSCNSPERLLDAISKCKPVFKGE